MTRITAKKIRMDLEERAQSLRDAINGQYDQIADYVDADDMDDARSAVTQLRRDQAVLDEIMDLLAAVEPQAKRGGEE